MTELTGWGRYPRHESELLAPSDPQSLPRVLARCFGLVSRGNGRAYGDAAIGERVTLSARGLDRMRAFDPDTGRLTVESGVLLSDILAAFVPRGFFPPVVPGTKFVTVGGMVAADVHGKNHHREGGLGEHVEELTLAAPGGEILSVSRSRHPELLAATVGGMGLTGTILDASFRLRPIETGWLRRETVPALNLDEALKALEASAGATYSVAWIDCAARGAFLGRALVQTAEHATRADLEALRPGADPFPAPGRSRLAVPLELPGWTLNRLSVRAFNELYFRIGAAKAHRPRLVHWDPFFFPLDGIRGWNRLYGRRGFLQHQCVVPNAAARPVLAGILDRLSRHGSVSSLAVLKQLGPGSGLLSFPMPGFTLSLDLRVTDDVFPLLDEIDRLVTGAGGRLYLAKDARQSRATFEAGYPALPAFRSLRRSIGAERQIVSRLSARLGI